MEPFDASENERIPDVKPIEKEVHRLTNEARQDHGRKALEWSDDLAYVAREHSRDMKKRSFVGHENPDGEHAFHRVRKYNLPFVGVAENIAVSGGIEKKTSQEIGEYVFNMWLTSEKGHRQNLLIESRTHEGVGIYMTDIGVFATQLIGDYRG